MAWKIKPGKMIMQNGKLYAEGCVLANIEQDLLDQVELTDETPADYTEMSVNGVPTFVADTKTAADLEIRTYSTSTDSIINNPDVNPLRDLVDQEPVEPVQEIRKPGRPKKS